MTAVDLAGQVAIVTGAGRGLGRAEALALAAAGARVVVNDVDTAAEEVVDEIVAAGGEAIADHADVADLGAAGALVDGAVRRFGRLDVLVNNAGIVRDRMVFTMSEREWDDVLRVHLRGHFCTTRWATAHWRAEAKAGRKVRASIVNTASEAFLNAPAGQPNYAAAKAGIVALTVSTAKGCAAYGVRANAICPRAATAMTSPIFADRPEDAQRLSPGHVAPLVVYLASDASAPVSGNVFISYGPRVGVLAPPVLAATADAAAGRWTPEAFAAAFAEPAFADRLSQGYAADDVVAAAADLWGPTGEARRGRPSVH
ncbi:SDR family NAD(P)-dependent oxidoreductase [Asanoa iriomotensis]|uniref:3-oxoacyl-ACP reductase n=1 Tax=Asanoa iriomotensis TaxID=234613 RepID=A0ABQ4C508_9ACTN|nr:SDR family NAD(P)-dependent oxidoreductase [Asanoa iriomotensis]GIF57491.1 3-oxoacyl-ACP reductase [Asanoa iriomotensis]